jgi:hypothetical protein
MPNFEDTFNSLMNIDEGYLGKTYTYCDRKTGDIYKRNPDGSYKLVGNIHKSGEKKSNGEGPGP